MTTLLMCGTKRQSLFSALVSAWHLFTIVWPNLRGKSTSVVPTGSFSGPNRLPFPPSLKLQPVSWQLFLEAYDLYFIQFLILHKVPQAQYQDPRKCTAGSAHRTLSRCRSRAAREKTLLSEGQATFVHFRSCVKLVLLDTVLPLSKMSAVWGNPSGLPLPGGPGTARSGWPSTMVGWASGMCSEVCGQSPASPRTLRGLSEEHVT